MRKDTSKKRNQLAQAARLVPPGGAFRAQRELCHANQRNWRELSHSGGDPGSRRIAHLGLQRMKSLKTMGSKWKDRLRHKQREDEYQQIQVQWHAKEEAVQKGHGQCKEKEGAVQEDHIQPARRRRAALHEGTKQPADLRGIVNVTWLSAARSCHGTGALHKRASLDCTSRLGRRSSSRSRS